MHPDDVDAGPSEGERARLTEAGGSPQNESPSAELRRIDVGMSAYYGGPSMGIEIVDGEVHVLK